MALDDKKLEAIEHIIKGETIADVARLVGVNRKTVYNWLSMDDFKAELDRQTSEQKTQIDKKILGKIEPILDKLLSIALKSKSDKTSLEACIYAINRLAGTPTNKSQDITKEEDTKDTISLDVVKDKVSSVLELDKKAN